MKKKITLLAFLIVTPIAFSQVGIGTTTPRGALEINSATTGFIAPQVALNNTTSSSPVVNPTGAALLAGTIVYNSVTVNDVTPGYYYWDGTIWVRMEGGSVASTPHNTLDEAYDEGGAGAGRIINSDSGPVEIINTNTANTGLTIINNSTSVGYSGQSNYVIHDGTIGVVADVNANGVGVLVDQFDTNNPYSGIQVTNYSSSNGSGILATTEGSGPSVSVEATSTSNAANAITAYNFRTNGGAAIDALGAIGIRSTSQVATGSGFAGYLNAVQGTAGQFNGTGLASLSPVSIFTGNHRYGLVAQGSPVGTYSNFTSAEGASYIGFTSAYGLWYGYALVTGGTFYDTFRQAQPSNDNKMMFNVVGPGITATTVKSNDKTVIMPAVSAPESLFQDYGTGKLVNGRAQITINPILSANILVDKEHPLKVFIQLEGECNGVYVTNKSSRGFEVVELASGTSDVSFSYSIIASRAPVSAETKEGRIQKFNAPNRFMTIDVNAEELQLLQENISKREEQKRINSHTKK